MKRQLRNKQNRALTNSRSLRIESLEDRQLMTVAAEMVQMPQESQIGSEHWPEPAAEIAVEKATNDRQGFFSRGLHNNGVFRAPGGHILWTAKDNSETSSDSYTDSGRVLHYAYELKNVQVTPVIGQPGFPSLLATDHFSHHANVDKVFGENKMDGRADEAGCQEEMKQGSEANVETRLFQRVDQVMSRLTPTGLLGGGDEDPGQPNEDDLSAFGDDDDVTDPNYTEDEQGGPANPLNDPRQDDNDEDEDEDDESNDDEQWKRLAEDWIRVLDHLSN